MDGRWEFQGFQDLTPNSDARRWSPNRGRGAVGVVPAAVRSPRDHSPLRGARRGAGKPAVSGRVAVGGVAAPPPTTRWGSEDRPAGPAYPACDVSAHWPSTSRRCGHAEAADWPVEREAGGGSWREEANPAGWWWLPWTLWRVVTAAPGRPRGWRVKGWGFPARCWWSILGMLTGTFISTCFAPWRDYPASFPHFLPHSRNDLELL